MVFKKGNKFRFKKKNIPWNKGKSLKNYPQIGFQKRHRKYTTKGDFKKGHIPKHKKINENELVRLYKSNKSIREISKIFKCKVTTIYQMLQKKKIKLREYPRGEKHHLWKGGISFEPYDKKFNNKFKRAIRKRDNYICLKCGKHQEKQKRALTIHHIDYNKELSIPQNCCAICNSCNSEVNFNRKHWTKFFQSLLSEKYGYQYSKTNEIILEVKNAK